MMNNKNVELLAPAGNYDAFIKAINNGANAIYMAGKNFNARTFANNFTIEEIKEMIRYAHSLNVKIYVTVNTLIKDSEIMDALKFVEQLYKADVDAILVQDIGLINILRKAYPDLELHASTQMNCTCVNDAKRLKELGFKRVVLARECSIETIKEIKENVDIEIEVFCHGALCMGYSGNCLMSSLIGGRSGNRGKCAQSCRREYTLEFDNNDGSKEKTEIDKKYYLSSKDLCTLEYINELKKIGVDSIKIEGRGKESEYVATVTKWYRNALDGKVNKDNIELGKRELKLVYNRKFTKGYIFNEKNSEFTNIDTVNHLGINIGSIIRVDKNYVYIKLVDTINKDDALRIVNKNYETKDALNVNNFLYLSDEHYKQGEQIKSARSGDIVKLKVHNDDLNVGYNVLKTKDSEIINEADNKEDKKIDINGRLFLKDTYLHLELSLNNIKVVGKTNQTYEEAKNKDMKDRIIDQVSKVNDTIFRFNKIEYVGEAVFLPIKEINELRRNTIDMLEKAIIDSYKKEYHFNKFYTKAIEYSNELRMYAKVRSQAQLNACIDSGIKYIITEDKKLYSLNKDKDVNLIYMNPRLAKEDQGIGIDKETNEVISSVYLNVMNIFAVNFMHENKVNIVGISPELSKKEIVEIVNRYKNTFKKNPNLMMQVYGRYEMMIMKHCIINKACKLDSKGCLECERHQYYLKDRKEYEFPLVKTIDCNVKLLNSRVTSLIDYLKEIIKIGVNNLLIDFTLESYEETLDVCDNYLKSFDNRENGVENNPYTTHGAYEDGIE